MKTLRLLSNLVFSLLVLSSLALHAPQPAAASGPSPAQAAWETIAVMDFEGAFPGAWLVLDNNGPTGGDYLWAPATARPFSGAKSGWPAAGGGDGTPPTAPPASYPANLNSGIGYGPFSLKGASDARVTFRFYIKSESSRDLLRWLASGDGGESWGGDGISGNSNGWQQYTYDLKNFNGQGDSLVGSTNVMIAFTFESNGTNNNYEGVYLDDIVIEKLTGSPACYTLTVTAEPSSAGSVTASPAPNCGSKYTEGTEVTLTATPANGFTFFHWSQGAAGTAKTVKVKMDADRSVTANFLSQVYYTHLPALVR